MVINVTGSAASPVTTFRMIDKTGKRGVTIHPLNGNAWLEYKVEPENNWVRERCQSMSSLHTPAQHTGRVSTRQTGVQESKRINHLDWVHTLLTNSQMVLSQARYAMKPDPGQEVELQKLMGEVVQTVQHGSISRGEIEQGDYLVIGAIGMHSPDNLYAELLHVSTDSLTTELRGQAPSISKPGVDVVTAMWGINSKHRYIHTDNPESQVLIDVAGREIGRISENTYQTLFQIGNVYEQITNPQPVENPSPWLGREVTVDFSQNRASNSSAA